MIGKLGRAIVAALVGTLTLVGLAATRTDAQSSLDAIRTRGVIRVGIKTDAPPFGSLDARGRHVGFEIDLARFFARVLFDDDGRAQLVPVTAATRFEYLAAGRVDLLIATVTASEERRGVTELSDPYFMSGSLLLVPARSAIRSLGDTAGQRVAVVKGSVQERDVSELQSRAIIVAVGSVLDGVRAVKRGESDAFFYDDVIVLGLAQTDASLTAIGPPIGPRPFVVAARKGNAGLIRWVNGWLSRMHRDGTYDVLWRRYFRAFESRLVGG